MTRLLMAGQLASYRGADSDDGRFLRSTTQPAASIRSSQARRSSWSTRAAPSKVRTRWHAGRTGCSPATGTARTRAARSRTPGSG